MQAPLSLAEGARFLRLHHLNDSPAESLKPPEVKLPARLGESLIPGGKPPEIMSAVPKFSNARSQVHWASAASHLTKWRSATVLILNKKM